MSEVHQDLILGGRDWSQETLLSFEKDGKKSHFDFKDGKWQLYGDLPIDETAKILFETLGEMIDLAEVRDFKKSKCLLL